MAVGILENVNWSGPREGLLVERIGDQLPEGVADFPVLKDLFDVEIKQPPRFGGRRL